MKELDRYTFNLLKNVQFSTYNYSKIVIFQSKVVRELSSCVEVMDSAFFS